MFFCHNYLTIDYSSDLSRRFIRTVFVKQISIFLNKDVKDDFSDVAEKNIFFSLKGFCKQVNSLVLKLKDVSLLKWYKRKILKVIIMMRFNTTTKHFDNSFQKISFFSSFKEWKKVRWFYY